MSFIIVFKKLEKSRPKRLYLQPSRVEYDAQIEERFALCKLRQTYNVSVENIEEASYQFPVDYNSAFCDLVIKTPREEIRGIVREKSEAKKMYDDAKSSGRQAFLTEESETDRDIYKLSIANPLNGDEIVVEYTYITEVTFDKGHNIFYIPSFISPRYGGDVIPNSNHSIISKVKISNSSLKSLKCSIPDTSISFENGFVTLEHSSREPLDSDIEITFDATYQNKVTKFSANDQTMAIAQFTPNLKKLDPNQTRELVFVLDCSGSMEGERIANSKMAIIHCLDKMRDKNFKFNIVRYGSSHQTYLPDMVKSTNENIDKAIKYCEKISADLGGTETFNALAMGLSMSKTVILITDGDTSNNNQMHKLCSRFDCLSILGIGSGINRANIKDMAKNGSGIALFSQTESNIIQNMNTIYETINTPSIKTPSTNWCENKNNLLAKYSIVSDQPNVMYAIISDPQPENFVQKDIGLTMDFVENNNQIDTKYLGCLVAKRIIQENEISDTFTKEQLVDLACKFNIITKYTSMIAISNLVVKPEPQPELQEKQSISQGGAHGGLFQLTTSGQDIMDTYNSTASFHKNVLMQSLMYQDSSVTHLTGAGSQLYHDMTCDPNDVLLMDSPDLAQTKDTGSILRNIMSAFSMRPTKISQSDFGSDSDCEEFAEEECDEDTGCEVSDGDCDSGSETFTKREFFTQSLAGRKCSLKTDANTDYLFDYFMNEDKFNEQMRGEWDEEMEKRIKKSKNKKSVQSDSDSEIESISDGESDNETFNKYLPLIRPIYQLLDKTQFTHKIFDHFDSTTGLFMSSVQSIINGIPNNLLNDAFGLTLLIFYCLKNIPEFSSEYQKYLIMARSKNNLPDLLQRICDYYQVQKKTVITL